jgi:hypothetical protein
LLLGAAPVGKTPLTIGMLEILSTAELSITGVYTATGEPGSAPAIEVVQIEPRTLLI